MAKILSFVMLVFTLVPAIAPSIGAVLIALAGWRGVFGAFIAFGLIGAAWVALRQPETLPPAARRPLSARRIGAGVAEILSHREVRLSIAVQTLFFGGFFGVLSTVQPTFDTTFGQGAAFPLWFAGISVVSAAGALTNARLVERLGMRRIVTATLGIQALLAAATAALVLAGPPVPIQLGAYVLWCVTVFATAGLTSGNLNAIAMEPLGHLAGLAASVVGALSTTLAIVIAIPIGLAFDGTPLSASLGIAACCGLGFALMRAMGPEAAPAPAA